MKTKNFYLKFFVIAAFLLFVLSFVSRAQFWDSSTGLMQAPSADMNRDGTFMITNNFVNKNSISSSYWGYHTFEYGFNINLWSRIEIGYVCVILNGKWKPNPTERQRITINQDRHFNAKLLLLKEGEFGLTWIPGVAIGFSDPISGVGGDYINRNVGGDDNGFFNRYYIVATKHFDTMVGRIGSHLGYQYNRRTDLPMNGPCVAVDWVPVWLDKPNFTLKTIAEFDSRTFNIGFIASIWQDRFEAMLELMAMKWINFGVRYRFVIKA